MPQPANLVKVDTVFTLGNGTGVQDSAEFGIWGQLNFTPSIDSDWDLALGILAQAAADHWAANVSETHYSNGCGLLHARAARCDAAGRTLNEAIKVPADPWTGASSDPSLPWHNSLVVSLYTYPPGTFVPKGGRRRGRVYLPPNNTSIMVDSKSGELQLPTVLGIGNDFAFWLTAVKTTVLNGDEGVWTPGVLSTTGNFWTAVTALRIDNKVDTQRRRERQQPAVVQDVPYPVS